jgi:hypothetical protein
VNTFSIPYNNEDIITRPITEGNSLRVVNNIKPEMVTNKTMKPTKTMKPNKTMKSNPTVDKPNKPTNPTKPHPTVDNPTNYRKKTGLRYL